MSPGVEPPIGTVPSYGEINLEGINGFSKEQFEAVMAINKEEWQPELAGVEEFFAKVGDKLPAELAEQRAALANQMA